MKCGEKVYRVYMNKGEVIVRKGEISPTGNFVPDDKPGTWMTQNPTEELKVEHGKVYCRNEEDIPRAIEMVKEHHKKYLKDTEVRMKRVKEKTKMLKEELEKKKKGMPIEKAIEILRNGSNKYMTEDYQFAYGMAIGALNILKKLEVQLYEREGSIKDVWDSFSDEQKELVAKCINGDMSVKEFNEKFDAVTKRQKRESNFAYEFKCTEAEYKAIKHALDRLYFSNVRVLSPTSHSQYYRNVTNDELQRIRVENAVITELQKAFEEVENV